MWAYSLDPKVIKVLCPPRDPASISQHQHQHQHSSHKHHHSHINSKASSYTNISYISQPALHSHYQPTPHQASSTMAGFTLMFAPTSAVFGRSGYNKDGDEEGQNKGRSGYNKGDDDDEGQNKGRSGYNKGDDDDEGENKGRSGYNDEEDK